MGEAGKLSLVATPIGNLEDITLRALRILREAEIIAAEDTRRTRILLSHFEIPTPTLISFHAHNEHFKCDGLLDQVMTGKRVALVSDAGTPAIADPGFFIVRRAVERGIEPEIIPGVSALTFAAVAAGIPVDRFTFYGFPPVKSGRKRQFFEALLARGESGFFYESPHRVAMALALIEELGGGARQAAVIREATKMHEEVLRGPVAELAEFLRRTPPKGEFVVAIGKETTREKEVDDE